MRLLSVTILSLFLLAQPAFAAEAAPATDAVRKAAEFLWLQQHKDGGWHSQTYGLLSSAQALTPFVLDALLQVPPEIAPPPQGSIDRAFEFLHKNVDKDGALGMADPLITEYPNYATALAVRAFVRAGRTKEDADRKLLDRMAGNLRRQQFLDPWKKDDPAYGAWGYGGPIRRPPDPGHVDLSMTRHVLEALRAWDAANSAPAFKEAGVFLGKVQNYDPKKPEELDGGFFFSTVVLAANKAGTDGKRYKSYGTTTADGILSLLAVNPDPKDARVKAAAAWLIKHHASGGVPGIPAGEKGWDEGIRFYYAAVSALVFTALKIPEADSDWRTPLREFLLKQQRADGSFANQNLIVKEDDPLIATPFALQALLLVR